MVQNMTMHVTVMTACIAIQLWFVVFILRRSFPSNFTNNVEYKKIRVGILCHPTPSYKTATGIYFRNNENNGIYSTPLLPLRPHTRIRHIPGLPPDRLNLFLNINILQLLHSDCFFRLSGPVPRSSCCNTLPALELLGRNVVAASGVEEIVTL